MEICRLEAGSWGLAAGPFVSQCELFTARSVHLGPVILLIVAFGSDLATQPSPPPADLVLVNGNVVTVDEKFSVASALAVRDGKFVAIGLNDVVRRHIGKGTRVIEGRGRTVIPGLIDTHVHALGVAEAEAAQPFRNLTSIGDAAGLDSKPKRHGNPRARGCGRRAPTRLDSANGDSPRGKSWTRRRRNIRSSSTRRTPCH